mgnify:CR=1 FL=1
MEASIFGVLWPDENIFGTPFEKRGTHLSRSLGLLTQPDPGFTIDLAQNDPGLPIGLARVLTQAN